MGGGPMSEFYKIVVGTGGGALEALFVFKGARY